MGTLTTRVIDGVLQTTADSVTSQARADAQAAAALATASAANAEAFTGPTFFSTAAGLAATNDGDFFAVNDAGIVTIYLNVDGVAVAQRDAVTAARLASATGAALVGTGDGRTVESGLRVLSDVVTLEQFGGDATPAFDNATAAASAIATGKRIDLRGLQYDIAALPADMSRFQNGSLRRISDNRTQVFERSGTWRTDGFPFWQFGRGPVDSVILSGAFPNANGTHRGVFAIGKGCLENATGTVDSVIAIGSGCLTFASEIPPQTIAIGSGTLPRLTNAGGGQVGTRNIGIGSLSGHFLTTGTRNVLLGRNAGSNITTGGNCTAIGYNALFAGQSPIGWSGEIEMQFGGMTASNATAVGSRALQYSSGAGNSALGANAITNVKAGLNNVGIGLSAGEFLDANISWGGKDAAYGLSNALTYVATSSEVVFTIPTFPSIGIAVGDTIAVRLTDGALEVEQGKAVVTGVSGNDVTIDNPLPGQTGSGAGTLWAVEKTTNRTAPASSLNVMIGRWAARNRLAINESVFIGDLCAASDSAGLQDTRSVGNTFVGVRAAKDHTTLTDCSGLGINAMRFMIDGGTTSTISNSTSVGANARVSGSDQLQLGQAAVTPYAFAALQIRSDERDKADIEPTDLGLDFIKQIEPVQYRWDMRDDYIDEIPEEERKAWFSNPVKDGSKKRSRMHQGVIAQQVRGVCEAMSVDFSGLQDHTVNGGCDVLTVAYEHFVPVLIKAVQELSAEVEALKAAKK